MNDHDRNGEDVGRLGRVSDEAIEAVFARRARRGEAGDLRHHVIESAAASRQRFGPWASIRVGLRLGAADRAADHLVLVLVLALIALTVLLLAGGLAGNRSSNPLSGGRLTFIRDGDLYLADGDGSHAIRFLHEDGTTFSNPAWSPDGARVAVDTTGGAILVDVGTGGIQRIGGTSPAWSPDGDRLAVIDSGFPGGDIVRIVALRAGSTQVLPVHGIGPLTWSPDGRWIAMTGTEPMALLRIDVSSGQFVQLDRSWAHLDAPRDPAWSPDSRRIAFTGWGNCDDSRVPCTTNVFVADADGSHATRVVTGSGSFDRPTWSPDGQWLAFRSAITNTLVYPQVSDGLVVARPDGTERRTIASANVDGYAWISESDGLLFTVRGPSGQPSQLWASPIDGVSRALGISVDASTFGSTIGFDWRTSNGDVRPTMLPPSPPATPTSVPAIGTLQRADPVDATGHGRRWQPRRTTAVDLATVRHEDRHRHDRATV